MLLKKKYLKSPDFLIATSEVLSKLATFIILPLAGLVLSTPSFNIWSLVFPSIQVLSAALSFGMPTFVLRSYYKDDEKEKKMMINQVYNFFLLIVLITAVIFMVIMLLKIPSAFFRWDIYVIIMTSSFLLIIQQKYQAEKKGFQYLLQSLIWRNFFALIFVGAVVFRFRIGLDSLLMILLVIQSVLCVWGIYKECLPFVLSFKRDIQVAIFKFGFPLFLIGMLQYMVSINGRFFVYNQGVENDTAVFSIIQTFIGGLNLLFVIFVRIYVPKLFGVLSGIASHDSLNIYKKIVFPLFEILGICILLFLFIYSSFYKESFDDMIFVLAPILIVGQFFYGIQIFVSDSIVYNGHTTKLLIINSVVTFISLALGFLLVRYCGVLGGTISVALSQLASLLLIALVARKLFKLIVGERFFLVTLVRISLSLLLFSMVYVFLGKTVLISILLVILIFLIWKFKKLLTPSFLKENNVL